jgi:hypothetical protein
LNSKDHIKKDMSSSLPADVTQPIDVALQSMHAHPIHLLLPIYRRAVYEGIDQAIGQKSHKIKVTLSLLAAQRVSSYWNIPLFMVEKDEADYDYWLQIPRRLIEIAKNILNANTNSDVILEEVSHLSEVDSVTGQTDDSPYYHEWCAFEAALSCVWEALNSDHSSLVQADNSITHETTDEELRRPVDTAMLACLAYTGGSWTPANPDKWIYDKEQKRWITDNRDWYFDDYGTWDRNTDMAISRRQEFWEWWLSQGVYEAWVQAQ